MEGEVGAGCGCALRSASCIPMTATSTRTSPARTWTPLLMIARATNKRNAETRTMPCGHGYVGEGAGEGDGGVVGCGVEHRVSRGVESEYERDEGGDDVDHEEADGECDVCGRVQPPAPLRRKRIGDPCMAGVVSRPRWAVGGGGVVMGLASLRSGPGS